MPTAPVGRLRDESLNVRQESAHECFSTVGGKDHLSLVTKMCALAQFHKRQDEKTCSKGGGRVKNLFICSRLGDR